MADRAKLPGLTAVITGNPALDRWIQAATERFEVREGARGDGLEKVVTLRDLQGGNYARTGRRSASSGVNGVVIQNPDGTYSTQPFAVFADELKQTALYQNMMTKLDDQSRFDALPTQIKNLLLQDIASEAAKRGADVQRIEYKQQSDFESLAYRIEEVTASVEGAAAGVRETAFASATANRATAGLVTQIQARLDDVGGTTIEESMTATADRVAGLAGEYSVKINAGGAVAGFGLAASEDPEGNQDSAFFVQANKFAIIAPGETVPDAATPNAARIPFGVDTGTNTIYINGQVRINTSGPTLDSLSSATGIYISYDSQFFKYNSAGTVVNSNITLTANLTGTLTGTVTWSTLSGYSGSPPTGTNTWVIAATSMTADAATFKIEKIDGGITYTDILTATKMRDGVNGDTGGTGAAGIRGTRQLYLSGGAYVSGYANYSTDATNAIALATSGSTPTTPIKGDTVTFTNGSNYTYTITYTGSAWAPPGVVIDGSLLVTGSVTASKIDTRGLDIKDASGNVIFSSGTGVSSALVSGLGALATQNTVAAASVTGLGALATQSTVAAGSVTGLGSLATQNTVAVGSVTGLGALATQSTVAVGSVTGLGALATQSYATVGSTVKMPDGAVMNTSDFVNRLSQLTSGNVSTFIAAGAIGEAYIGTLTAGKIDTRGLSIKDAAGNVILSAGSTLQAQIGTSANLMPNSDLSAEAHNWGLAWNAGGGSDYTIAKDLAGTPWMPAGGHQIGVVRGGTAGAASSWFDIYYTPRNIPVMPGKRYEASVYAAAHRCPVYLLLIYLDSAGAYVTEASFGPTTAGGGQDLNSWGRIGGIITIPGGATQVSLRLRGGAATSADPYFWGTRFFFGEAGSAQTELSPWSPGATGALADFGYSGALNATFGATFGSNISGQITAANVSTYIANAAIQAAHIGSLTADVITAGTLNVDRINAGSIVTSKLNDGAITTVKITDNSVTVPLTRYWAAGSYETLYGTGAAVGVQLVSTGSPRVSDVPSITTPSGASAFIEMKLSLECALVYGGWHKIDFLVDGGVVASKYFTPPSVNGHAVITHDLTSSAGTHTYGVNLIYYGGSGQICSYIYNFNFTVKATFK